MRAETPQTIQATDNGDTLSVVLPPSQHGWAVVITKGVRTPSQVSVLENRPPPPSTLSRLSQHSTLASTDAGPVDVEAINARMHGLHLEGRVVTPQTPSLWPPPSHLRECSPHERFRVSKDIQALYPPANRGWARFYWYIVIRGREVGIFNEFWARIRPLVKNSEEEIIPGASWEKVDGMNDAFEKWAEAVKKGSVDRI